MRNTTARNSDVNYDFVNVYTPEKFKVESYLADCGIAPHTRQYHKRKENNTQYFNCISAFDIETTADAQTENAFMWVWMWSFDNNVVIGRTWEEFNEFAAHIKEVSDKMDTLLPVYVHNLSYEFHFLRGICEIESAFATRKRKIIKAVIHGCEFRCSFFLTHLSLAKLTSKYDVKHAKSEMKYDVFRTHTTPITREETTYIINDVIGLAECIRAQLIAWGDDLYSIPLTQTGYVRREVKNRMNYKKFEVQKHFPDYDTYTDLLAAFRGGNTHANRHYAGKIIKNVHNVDIASSYPAQMVFRKFPMSKFIKHDRKDGTLTDTVEKQLLTMPNTALLMRVQFFEIEVNELYGVPYLPVHKCIGTGVIEDNGRILYATYCETVITDIDFKIICSHYTFKGIEFQTIYTSRYGFLYKEITDFIIELFKNKTELKGVDDELYMRSKEMINSVYGLCAERVLHDAYELIGNKIEETAVADIFGEYAKQGRRAYKLYAWGVWVTSWARYDLQRMIDLAHKEGTFLYADTDSVKFTGDLPIEKFNAPLIERAVARGMTGITKKGEPKYCGIWEREDDYRSFATIGAKKYAYVDTQGKLHITIAGVSKESGAHELSDYGGLSAFVGALHDSFTFDIAGGTGVKFNDDTYETIERNGEKIRITPNAYIYEDVSTLSVTSDYEKLVNEAIKKVKKEGG